VQALQQIPTELDAQQGLDVLTAQKETMVRNVLRVLRVLRVMLLRDGPRELRLLRVRRVQNLHRSLWALHVTFFLDG